MLVRAAFHLAGAVSHERGLQHNSHSDNSEIKSTAAVSAVQIQHRELLDKAAQYIKAKGGVDALRARYGKDKTFAVPILTNCALAGLVDWREVSSLPFELAAFPQSWYRFVRLPVVSYAIPALVAIGQARFLHVKPRNPLVRAMRAACIGRTLGVLGRMQPASGGYLEAIPLTSFVVMSLAGTGRAGHPVAQSGVQFLLDTVRTDGSWPIDTNLATWVTTLAINAVEGSEFRVQGSATARSAESPKSYVRSPKSDSQRNGFGTWDLRPGTDRDRVIDWLLSCQHSQRHPFTGAAPGGWGWSDLSGAVPDVDDTSGALLALAKHAKGGDWNTDTSSRAAALHGIRWLLNVQNKDGGWPTFCRGWGTLPFDRSAPDLTAHAMRAIAAWISDWNMDVRDYAKQGIRPRREFPFVKRKIEHAFDYLAANQRSDGSWVPLWFGNQDHPQEENPVYGTSRVLLAYRDLQRMNAEAAGRAVQWLTANQSADGGLGNCKFQEWSPKSPVTSSFRPAICGVK